MKPVMKSLSRSLVVISALSTVAALPVHAAAITDRAGDFLRSYTGPHDADLDVIAADVVINTVTDSITFTGTVNGPIDTTSANKFYAFGVDRGRGAVGRDLVFQGPLGVPNAGDPKIGANILFDAVVGLTADGKAIFFDALNPGIVPLPDVAVTVHGNEISATVPLSLLPSQGFKFKQYTYNFWPRSQLSLLNTTLSDFAPSHRDARVTVIDKFPFEMVRAAKPVASGCLPHATAEVKIKSDGPVERMHVSVDGLPSKTNFDFFVIQKPGAPFGLAWYQGDIETDEYGHGEETFIGRFNEETFIVAPGSVAAPLVHSNAFPDAAVNPVTGPVHTFHLGLWFNALADAVKAGCPDDVTPFNGEHNAGIQVLNTSNFPDLQGPLLQVKP